LGADVKYGWRGIMAIKTNAYEFEIVEGGSYPKKYKLMVCDECGSIMRNWKGSHRDSEFFVMKDGSVVTPSKYGDIEPSDLEHEYATLRCDDCDSILVWFRVQIGSML
jgi:hypothetical protein